MEVLGSHVDVTFLKSFRVESVTKTEKKVSI